MKETLTRRSLIGRAGMMLGGALALPVLKGCGSDDGSSAPPPTDTTTSPQVSDFPYQKHLPAGYQLDVAAVKEAAYHGYYAGGCCHGAYSGLLKHLADTVGPPFSLLPVDFGGFGGGGVAGYGSICGAPLGALLVINSIVPNVAPATATAAQKNVRNRMITELLRWYEGFGFPAYVPQAVDAAETGLTLSFAAADMASRQHVPGSHLCHASVTTWCAANGNVPSSGPDKKARCARLTADVAGKAAEMLNAYLATGEFVAATSNPTTTCVGCHTQTAADPAAPVAAGMECTTCHPLASHPLPVGHLGDANCGVCHHTP